MIAECLGSRFHRGKRARKRRKVMLRNTKRDRRAVIAALVVLVGLMTSTSTPRADSGNPGVFPPNSRPYGLTYGQWSARYLQWELSIPYSSNPNFVDTASFDVGQSGPVWFLAADNFRGSTRSCTIPAGKAILTPLYGYLNDYPCPDPNFQPAPGQSLKDFLTQGAKDFIDQTLTGIELEVDGVPLKNLFSYRATSDLFDITFDPSLTFLDPCATGSPQPAVSDGYWLMLAPLSVGTHTIHFHETGTWFDTEATYTLTVAAHK
jgi:hypothetical protein